MACLFWKKKTDVVDMKKDSITKKQKLTVDRSERSRRVLKMESMRELPTKQQEESETDTKIQTTTVKQMFLPSENPTGIIHKAFDLHQLEFEPPILLHSMID